jgi:hypothetical protein
MRRALLLVVLVCVLLVGAACGSGRSTVIARPAAVPTNLVPTTLPSLPDFSLSEFAPARASFAHVGASSLVADGRLWQVRRGASLVGTLQISTVKPDVSVTKASDRNAILAGVMTGISYETVDIAGISVAVSTSVDKSLYLWFGPGLFEVMQLKGSQLDPEQVVTGVIQYQEAKAGLTPVAEPDTSS